MSRTITQNLRAGALGAALAVVATTAMSAVMLVAQRAGLMGELPPHRIANKTLDRMPTDADPGPRSREALGWVAHYGFGALAGAVYGVLRAHVRTPGPGTLHGAGYALGVWAISYLGWVPALRLLPHATHDRPGRQPSMIVAHLVFGGLLGSMFERTFRRR
jgi:hypothetical protein